jgi:hypothetical protein
MVSQSRFAQCSGRGQHGVCVALRERRLCGIYCVSQRTAGQFGQLGAGQSKRACLVEATHGFVKSSMVRRRCATDRHDLFDPGGNAKHRFLGCKIRMSPNVQTAEVAVGLAQQLPEGGDRSTTEAPGGAPPTQESPKDK